MQEDVYKIIEDLSDRVQFLEDKLIKQQRENADLSEQITRISESGISASLIGNIKKKFSDISQTEDKISSTVADLSDETRKKYSKIEQTAEKVTVEVSKLSGEVDNVAGDVSRVEFKADNISSTVTKIYNEAVAVKSESEMTDKSLMYYYNGKYRYYNDVTQKWVEVNSESVVSQFIQTANGFILNGNVKISGDQIVDGIATLRDNVNVGDVSTMDEQRGITFNSVAKMSTINNVGGVYDDDEYAGLSISAPLLKLGSRVDFSNATVTGLYAVFE